MKGRAEMLEITGIEAGKVIGILSLGLSLLLLLLSWGDMGDGEGEGEGEVERLSRMRS